MEMTERQIYLSALTYQEAMREILQIQFKKLLEEHDIFVTHETFAEDKIGTANSFTLNCHLQAPTIADTAGRLIKAGWKYEDGYENRENPCLIGPRGESIHITREDTCAKLVYLPAEAEHWAAQARKTAGLSNGSAVCPPAGFKPRGATGS